MWKLPQLIPMIIKGYREQYATPKLNTLIDYFLML